MKTKVVQYVARINISTWNTWQTRNLTGFQCLSYFQKFYINKIFVFLAVCFTVGFNFSCWIHSIIHGRKKTCCHAFHVKCFWFFRHAEQVLISCRLTNYGYCLLCCRVVHIKCLMLNTRPEEQFFLYVYAKRTLFILVCSRWKGQWFILDSYRTNCSCDNGATFNLVHKLNEIRLHIWSC